MSILLILSSDIFLFSVVYTRVQCMPSVPVRVSIRVNNVISIYYYYYAGIHIKLCQTHE